MVVFEGAVAERHCSDETPDAVDPEARIATLLKNASEAVPVSSRAPFEEGAESFAGSLKEVLQISEETSRGVALRAVAEALALGFHCRRAEGSWRCAVSLPSTNSSRARRVLMPI